MVTPENKRWGKIWFKPWWSDYKDLVYVNEPFNDPISLERWKRLGYTQTKFTGDMYDMRKAEPAWISPFRIHLPWQHFSWSVYRMGPGSVLPNHSDIYTRFKKLYKINNNDSIFRAIVFLEDWQSGHYFEIAGDPVTHWIAGDTYIWQYDVEHLAANVGTTDRYTLQITGVPNENPFL